MPKLASFGWKQDKSGSNARWLPSQRTWVFHNLLRDRSTTHLFVHNECLPFHFLYNDSSGCLESHEDMVERRPDGPGERQRPTTSKMLAAEAAHAGEDDFSNF
ncbi:hypothetical protein CAPTEDRAFT_187182 [Capitella teleta]|uniref:Uncharacterized protein n=1 Tax=Capitella teleta TaxID=283909 RepID=R7VHQ1_CAPTE|nr:hypothetical protein CAPTEDRAFT_187182 [Capitella teleta]|eukprot:ELU15200.1 hypothetical protein CAPTEDRAFT_187182 [Capitella teleta]